MTNNLIPSGEDLMEHKKTRALEIEKERREMALWGSINSMQWPTQELRDKSAYDYACHTGNIHRWINTLGDVGRPHYQRSRTEVRPTQQHPTPQEVHVVIMDKVSKTEQRIYPGDHIVYHGEGRFGVYPHSAWSLIEGALAALPPAGDK